MQKCCFHSCTVQPKGEASSFPVVGSVLTIFSSPLACKNALQNVLEIHFDQKERAEDTFICQSTIHA